MKHRNLHHPLVKLAIECVQAAGGQKKLADATGLCRKRIGNWFHGISCPNAEAFGILTKYHDANYVEGAYKKELPIDKIKFNELFKKALNRYATQAHLARVLAVSPQQVNHVATGRTKCSKSMYNKLLSLMDKQ